MDRPGQTDGLRRLAGLAKGRRGMLALGLALTLASTAAALVPPALTQPLIDDVLSSRGAGRPRLVALYLGGMAAAVLASWLLGWGRTVVMGRLGERVGADLRDKTYRHLLDLSLQYHGGQRTGDLLARLGTDTERVAGFLSTNLVDFATDALMIVGTMGVLLVKAPTLALATLLPLPIAGWVMHKVRVRLRRGFERGAQAWSALNSVMADAIPGVRVVKAFAQEGREYERFNACNRKLVEVNEQVQLTWSFFNASMGLMAQGGLLLVWTVGSWLSLERGLRVGVLTMFLAYLARFHVRLESLSRMVQFTARADASARRVFEVLDTPIGVPEPSRPAPIGRLKGSVELRHVGFSYGDRGVLRDLNLCIGPGEFVGLVGPSGAGKSTLVNLICRLHDVGSGTILVDDVDVRRYPIAAFRRQVGLVQQDPFLFHGSIADNIAYGRPDASREDVIRAARIAHADAFIARLPDGYDAQVGERGGALSGGERQRISIARAVLIDPRILILDEATSAVDPETEALIQDALDNLSRGRTTIAIAHRLGTLRRADRLIVLEDGRIAEVGRHRDLVRAEGPYRRLHRAHAGHARGVAGPAPIA